MSSESLYNSQLNHNGFNENNNVINNRRLQQQQQAQNLFRQRQMISQQQQQQQRPQPALNSSIINTLPPTPTLSSQGSPAFSQVAQQVVPPAIKSVLTLNNNNKNILPTMTNTPQRTTGMGQAVLRLLQFRDQLSPGDQAQDITFWNSFVEDFFTPNAILKLNLWNNTEQKHGEFDIMQNLIARFFHTHYQCELESMQLTTDQTMEYFLPTGMMLECPRSSIIHRYKNGTLVILSGELSVLFNLDQNDGVLKIHQWKFNCTHHDEYIARSKLVPVDMNAASKKKIKAKLSLPAFHTPEIMVNSWGVPERMTNLLNITDASIRFSEVVFFSQITGLPPQDALAAMSFALSQQMPFSYPEGNQRQQTKGTIEDIMSSPLLTTDLLSLSTIPENTDSNLFMQGNTSAAPTPTPNHNVITSNMTPQQQHNTLINQNNIMVNSPQQINHVINTPRQSNNSMMGTPQQSHSMAGTPQPPHNIIGTPQPPHNIIGTPQQSHSMVGTPQQAHNMMGTPQQANTMMGTPQQANTMMGTPQQANTMMGTPQQANTMMGTPQQANTMMGTPQQANTMMGTPQQANTMMGTPQQANTMISTPQPSNTMINNNSNIQPNAQAMQRYYQQQRIQKQQQALQFQQHQALQRLNNPYTTSPIKSEPNMQPIVPPPPLTIENVTPETAKVATPRKRKMSTPKEKKAPKKGKKQQQQQV